MHLQYIHISQGHNKVTSHVDLQIFSILDLSLLLQYYTALPQKNIQQETNLNGHINSFLKDLFR